MVKDSFIVPEEARAPRALCCNPLVGLIDGLCLAATNLASVLIVAAFGRVFRPVVQRA